MKKIYRLLTLISFLFLIGLIIFFIIKITPKYKTKIYKDNVDYYVLLNTNKLDKKSTIISVNDNEYIANMHIVEQQENIYFYYLSFNDLNYEFLNNVDVYVYLPDVSLIKYLTTKY